MVSFRLHVSLFLFVAVLEGIWSTWSPWSGCNQDCVKHRRRTCNADTLSLETICPGDERDMASCSGDFCYSKQKFIFPYLQANYFKDPYFLKKKIKTIDFVYHFIKSLTYFSAQCHVEFPFKLFDKKGLPENY